MYKSSMRYHALGWGEGIGVLVWAPYRGLSWLCPRLLAGLGNVLAAGAAPSLKCPGHRVLPMATS